ncbi:MAG: TonB-dependent receptor [Acidobacteriaceae bacterium]|nr:TonB-dependent receptor [Acidobacteriaceae bacterium]
MRLFLFLAFSLALLAQVDTGSISGTVRDAGGQLVPAAKVKFRNAAMGLTLEAATNTEGIYVSPPLRPGEYIVEVEAGGFERAARSLQLAVSERVSLDFQLKVGSVNTTVDVVATAAVLQTESATLSNLRGERQIKDLPLNGRNFANLIGLAAGAMPAQTQTLGSPITMKRGVTGFALNGQRFQDNNFLLDGINNNENHNGLGILIFPPIEAVEEFRIESSVANAQFGRGGGGTVNLTFKSGGRDYHGGLFHFLRNSAFDARNFFDAAVAQKPPFKLNQFGGFVGGRLNPRSKDPKTFFFMDYQGGRIRQAQSYVSNVPIAAFRNGDFSAAAQRVFDPLTQRRLPDGRFERDQFPSNRLPASRIDRTGQNILSLYPAPNLGTGLANNFTYNPVRSQNDNSVDVKIDRQLSQRDLGWFRLSWGNNDLDEPSFLPAPAVGNGPGVPGLNTQPVLQAVISETHTFSPSAFNEARFGFTRLNLRSFNANFGRNVSEEIGVRGANVAGDALTSGLTIFNIGGLQALGDNGFSPAVIVSENLQFNDNFTLVRGKHTLKFGGELQRRRYNAFQSNVLRGTMTFGTNYTSNPAAPAGTGLGAAEALLGRPVSGSIRFLSGTRGFRRTELALYAQDDYKVTERLTLNFGLRWEDYLGWPWTEVNNRMYAFVPGTQEVARVGSSGFPASGIGGDHNNFGPRFGWAYRLGAKSVIRSGYGIYYSAPTLDITRNLGSNPPEFIVFEYLNDQFDFAGARPASAGFERPAVGQLNGATLNSIQPGLRMPYTQQWNFSVQQQLPAGWNLTVAYVGTKGTKLNAQPDINRPVPGTTPIAQRRPYPRFTSIQEVQHRQGSIYHGLQATAERRMARGLNFLAAYTYSHAIDENSGPFNIPMDVRNFRLDRGNADFDVRQRLAMSWTWELPVKVEGPLRRVIGGWQTNGIVSLYDGLPFSVNSATNSLNIGSGTRADRLRGGALPAGERTIDRWFDTAAFTAPGPQLFGNGGRNILRGPGTKQLDFSVFKDFPFGTEGGRRLQFRTEFFNLTNTPQFNNPNATVGAPGAGTIRSAGAPLTFQRTSRQIQLALKFYF